MPSPRMSLRKPSCGLIVALASVREELQRRRAVLELQRDAELADRELDAERVAADDQRALPCALEIDAERVGAADLQRAGRRDRHEHARRRRSPSSRARYRCRRSAACVQRERERCLDRARRPAVELERAVRARRARRATTSVGRRRAGSPAAMKPAAAFGGGAVNERSIMLPTSSATMPSADCALATSARRAAPSSAASLSAS